MTPFKPNITKSIDNLPIIQRDLELVYGKDLPVNIDKMLEDNVDNKSGSNLTYNNTVDSGKLDFDIIGNTEQNTINGQQLIDCNDMNTLTNATLDNNEYFDINYENTTETNAVANIFFDSKNLYSVSTQYAVVIEVESGSASIHTSYASTNSPFTTGVDADVTTGTYVYKLTTKSDLSNTLGLRLYVTLPASSTTQIKIRCSVIADTTITPETFVYKKYVGGIPSPNPDYPQEIKIVTGDNIITITNEDSSKSQTYTIHLGSQYLAGIGDYKDYITGTKNNWKIVRNIGKTIKTSINTTTIENLFISSISDYLNQKGFCSHFKVIEDDLIINNERANYILNNGECAFRAGEAKDRLYYKSSKTKEELDLLEKLIYYVLKTPTEINITDTTLIADLNALHDAVTYKGQTNISVESDSDNAQMLIDASLFVTEKEV